MFENVGSLTKVGPQDTEASSNEISADSDMSIAKMSKQQSLVVDGRNKTATLTLRPEDFMDTPPQRPKEVRKVLFAKTKSSSNKKGAQKKAVMTFSNKKFKSTEGFIVPALPQKRERVVKKPLFSLEDLSNEALQEKWLKNPVTLRIRPEDFEDSPPEKPKLKKKSVVSKDRNVNIKKDRKYEIAIDSKTKLVVKSNNGSDTRNVNIICQDKKPPKRKVQTRGNPNETQPLPNVDEIEDEVIEKQLLVFKPKRRYYPTLDENAPTSSTSEVYRRSFHKPKASSRVSLMKTQETCTETQEKKLNASSSILKTNNKNIKVLLNAVSPQVKKNTSKNKVLQKNTSKNKVLGATSSHLKNDVSKNKILLSRRSSGSSKAPSVRKNALKKSLSNNYWTPKRNVLRTPSSGASSIVTFVRTKAASSRKRLLSKSCQKIDFSTSDTEYLEAEKLCGVGQDQEMPTKEHSPTKERSIVKTDKEIQAGSPFVYGKNRVKGLTPLDLQEISSSFQVLQKIFKKLGVKL